MRNCLSIVWINFAVLSALSVIGQMICVFTDISLLGQMQYLTAMTNLQIKIPK